MDGRIQVTWAQNVGLSIRGGALGGQDREGAGAYIDEILSKHFGGQMLYITVRLPGPRPVWVKGLDYPFPKMVD